MKITLQCEAGKAQNSHDFTLTTEEFENINFIEIQLPTKFKTDPDDTRNEEVVDTESYTVLLEDFYLALKTFYEKKQIQDKEETEVKIIEALEERSVAAD